MEISFPNPPKFRSLKSISKDFEVSESDLLITARDNDIDISTIIRQPIIFQTVLKRWLSFPNTEDGLFEIYSDFYLKVHNDELQYIGDQTKPTMRGIFAIGNDVINDIMVYGNCEIKHVYDYPAQVYKDKDGIYLNTYEIETPMSITLDDLIVLEKDIEKLKSLLIRETEPSDTTIEYKDKTKQQEMAYEIEEVGQILKQKYPYNNTTDLLEYADELTPYKKSETNARHKVFLTDCLERAGIPRGGKGKKARPLTRNDCGDLKK